MRFPCFSSWRTVSQKMQRSLSLNHSWEACSSYLMRRGTKIVALHVHDALSLFLFLAHGIAENAALFVLEPFVGSVQLVLNAPRHENRRPARPRCAFPVSLPGARYRRKCSALCP